MRVEKDLLGSREIDDDVLYGIQSSRARDNFNITGQKLDPDFILSLGAIKKAAIITNVRIGRLDKKIGKALVKACDEVIQGRHNREFIVDPIQGGAGTSINMNINEVIANRALEIIGEKKGNYEVISPNNHANMGQSTNDVLPTAVKLCILLKARKLKKALEKLQFNLDAKSMEFDQVLKMGRTHLQDAVPITLGQELKGYSSMVERSVKRLDRELETLKYINMGATAVGTGLNSTPEYIKMFPEILTEMAGIDFKEATNLVDSTSNIDCFADFSSALKNTSLGLIKMCNDFRLMASGPKCGLNELKLPARQPGSSIMPGKVDPVIAEVLNQTCYQVIGNDLAVSMAVENGQFELNVMLPVAAFNIFNSMKYLTNAVNTFVDKLLIDLKVNSKRCNFYVHNSIGVVTALLPHLGYQKCSEIAKEALETNKPVKDIVLEHELLSKEDLAEILKPEEMTKPGIAGASLLNKKK